MRTTIVGTKSEWRGAEAMAVLATLQVGDLLSLRRDPKNEHDPNAIAVCRDHHILGYIPRAHNRELAAVLDREPDSCIATVTSEPIMHNGEVRFAPKILISEKEPSF